MLSCSNCDASLKLNAKLCIKCGHVISDEEREAAVTGVQIKKPVATPTVIQEAASIVEPIDVVEEKTEVLVETQPVGNVGSSDVTPLSSKPQEMIEAIEDSKSAPAIAEFNQALNLDESKIPERKLEGASLPIPTATFTAKKSDLSNKEKLSLGKDSASRVNPKLIFLGVVGLLVVGIGAFIFMRGEKGGKTPAATPMPTESVSGQSSPQPVTPIAPEVKPTQPSTVESPTPQTTKPPTPQPTKPPATPPVQEPITNSQSTAVPVVIPDLNKLVKDAINK